MKIIKKDINGDSYNKGFSNWHCNISYQLEDSNTTIKISDSVGGCGLQQIYGWYNHENKEEIINLLDYLMVDLHEGTSCVICQVGSNFYNSKLTEGLEKNNFFISAEYINLQHGGYGSDDTQRIYMYIPNNAKLDEKN